MVNYAVCFGPDELIKRGISNDQQAAVLVHELFGQPAGEIYGYQGDSETARKIKNVLQHRYGAFGRLKRLNDEEWNKYYPHPFTL